MRYQDPVRLLVYCRQPRPNGCAETEQTEVGDTYVDALGKNVPPFGSHRWVTSWRFSNEVSMDLDAQGGRYVGYG